jgi:hypothetical protein
MSYDEYCRLHMACLTWRDRLASRTGERAGSQWRVLG